MILRPDWRTIRRHIITERPFALAVKPGECPRCGAEVEESEPIVHVGSQLVRDPDGSVTVDLSGSEWICQRPHENLEF
ncbi:MAG: hypothetical protein M3O70_08735 [Actinomycetota bacterium]|nr:hypothetical protein [Actinomycetota bacterium]